LDFFKLTLRSVILIIMLFLFELGTSAPYPKQVQTAVKTCFRRGHFLCEDLSVRFSPSCASSVLFECFGRSPLRSFCSRGDLTPTLTGECQFFSLSHFLLGGQPLSFEDNLAGLRGLVASRFLFSAFPTFFSARR